MEDERTNEDEGWDPTRAIEGEPRRDRDTERERIETATTEAYYSYVSEGSHSAGV